jgi:NADPH-dependent F420 reductase
LGGTGPAGRGIASRLAEAGHDVLLGSRSRERANGIVDELRSKWGDRVATITGAPNEEAAAADVVILATVWDATVDTATSLAASLAGKTVVVMANGVERGRRELKPVLPPEGSISAAVQKVAPDAQVVAALQHIPAADLEDLDHPLSCDVMVASDHDAARETVLALVDAIPGLRAFDAGSLANAAGIEAFTAALITVNIRQRGEASLRLVGVEPRTRQAPP